RDTQPVGDLDVMLGRGKGRIQVLEDVESAEQHEWRVVGDADAIVDADGQGHGGYSVEMQPRIICAGFLSRGARLRVEAPGAIRSSALCGAQAGWSGSPGVGSRLHACLRGRIHR